MVREERREVESPELIPDVDESIRCYVNPKYCGDDEDQSDADADADVDADVEAEVNNSS